MLNKMNLTLKDTTYTAIACSRRIVGVS